MTDPNDTPRPQTLDTETHQHSARNDPSMRDGDSGHGNPYESGADPASTDADVGDSSGVELDTADSETIVDGTLVVCLVPTDAGPSAGEIGRLVRADDRSDRDHPAEDGPGRALPIEGFDQLTVPQVVEKLDSLSPDQVRAVREYEAAHRNRKTLLRQIDRTLGGNRRPSRKPG